MHAMLAGDGLSINCSQMQWRMVSWFMSGDNRGAASTFVATRILAAYASRASAISASISSSEIPSQTVLSMSPNCRGLINTSLGGIY